MLHVHDLSNNILTNIDINLQEGENLVILGSNGAGKSTLAKVLCGIIYSESVELFGKRLHTLSAKERASFINYVPPKLDIFDEYISLREYLELSRISSDLSIEEVSDIFDLRHLQDKTCISLSSGEGQLTLLGASILHGAKITVFDEPTANLDPKKMLKAAKIIKSDMLKNKIVITHDLNLAYKLGYKILYLSDGKMSLYEKNADFFKDSNIKELFGESIKKVDDYFAVNL